MKNSKVQFKIKKNERKQIVIDKPGRYVVELMGQGAKVEILGALVGRDDDLVTVDVTTIHKAKDTEATTMLRAVAYDRAKIALSGTIKIEKGAQKTNAFLKENVLLMSHSAQAEAIPNLEIEADDVHASHAATVSKVSEEEVFYLMSRGLTRHKAEKIIVDGFLETVKERISNS